MENKNTIIWIIVVIIIIILGVVVVGNRKAQAPANVQNQTQEESTAEEESLPNNEVLPIGNNQNEGSANTDTQVSSTAIVTYTDEGFSPSTLEIKLGDSVMFVNESSGGMWVASGPHPTHTLLPSFDQKTTVQTGGTYTYTFTQAGEWPFHNHVKSSEFGKVIVK